MSRRDTFRCDAFTDELCCHKCYLLMPTFLAFDSLMLPKNSLLVFHWKCDETAKSSFSLVLFDLAEANRIVGMH